MIRVVIDTGIVISAAFRDREPERLILFISENKEFEWVVSPEILQEYNDVLGREKFGLPIEVLEDWRETLRAITTLIDTDIHIEFKRDKKDAKFLECALAANAGYLITGDKDFEEAQSFPFSIISITEFLRLLAKTEYES